MAALVCSGALWLPTLATQQLSVLLLRQDAPVAGAMVVFMTLLRIAPSLRSFRSASLAKPRWSAAVVLASAVVAVGAVGWWVAYQRYPLSLDEFMATFDAAAFRQRTGFATVAADWRRFVPALQPLFMFTAPGGAHWASAYLPVNAMFRALFGLFGAEFLANPVWSGVSVLAVYGVARRLWPDRPDAALVAAVLLATSSQLLVTAMSPYAMPAHLALNLVWLWLFLRDRPLSDAAALATAFAACGLHQLVFHPLFVAPFVLQLWTSGRRRRALMFTGVYAVIGVFWMSYWSLLLHLVGMSGADVGLASQGSGPATFLRGVWNLIAAPDKGQLSFMTANLIRFITWQNPLAIALGGLALAAAWRSGGALRGLVAGLGLTLAVLAVVMPAQGHGWGYRYLHGLLGSVCLIAALGWIRLTDKETPSWKPHEAWTALAATSAFCLLCLLPWRAYQVHQFILPFARARAAMLRTDADVILVDSTGLFFAGDMVRNDPFLRNRPKIMNLAALSREDVDTLCAHDVLALFDRTDGEVFDIRTDPGGVLMGLNPAVATAARDPVEMDRLRAKLHDRRCAIRHVAQFTTH